MLGCAKERYGIDTTIAYNARIPLINRANFNVKGKGRVFVWVDGKGA